MELKKLNHIAINTKNLEDTLAFYHDVLGFETGKTQQTDTFASTFLCKPNVCDIEIIHTLGDAAKSEILSNNLVDHIAFDVDDVRKHEEELKKTGLTIETGCTEMIELNTRLMKIRDPNGICISLRENIYL